MKNNRQYTDSMTFFSLAAIGLFTLILIMNLIKLI